MFKEFKEFAIKGNAVDLAIGVVIGAAFGKIVSSLVGDIINPIVGILTGGVDFAQMAIVLKEGTDTVEAVTIGYGLFINTVVDFIIIAFVIFLVVKQMNRMKRVEEAVSETPKGPTEVELLSEIRDSLRK